MASPLLSTKLYLPASRPGRVLRPRLLAKLNNSLRPGCKLVMISAPAGFGKTTLAAEWIGQCGQPAAWLSLDAADNDLTRLWQYILAALQSIFPGAGSEMSAALQAAQVPPFDPLLTLLINDLAAGGKPFLLALDDFHLIENEQAVRTINDFLDSLPPGGRLVVLTRADPPLQLARRRARAEMVELRAADLRFTPEEVERFLTGTMSLSLGTADIAALETRTEGWIAGLQMAALALQSQAGAPGAGGLHPFISAFTGDDRFIADYLVEEVLQRQPEPIRQFLLRTSILERLSGSLCDALEDEEGKQWISTPSAIILDHLDHANLFTIPLDNRREWYRYHPLFAQLLRQRLVQDAGPQRVRELYRRASNWHLEHGFPVEAVDYALASGDMEAAAQRMIPVLRLMFQRSELSTLMRWCDSLPQQTLSAHPDLCAAFGWAANATGQVQRCDEMIGMMEEQVGMTVEAFLALDEAARGQIPIEQLSLLVEASVQHARQTLDRGDFAAITQRYPVLLPYLNRERDSLTHVYNLPSALYPPMAYMIAVAQDLQGELKAAVTGFARAAEEARLGNNIHIVALGLGHLGQTQMELGDLQAAEETFREALAAAAGSPGQVSAFFGIAHSGLGNLLYERDELQAARLELEQGVALGRLWNSYEALMAGTQGMARLRLASDDAGGAAQAIDELESARQSHPAYILPFVEAWRAQLWLAQGQTAAAESWARRCGYDLEGEPEPATHEHAIFLARLLLAAGRPTAAQRLLERQAEKAARVYQRRSWLRLQALLARSLAAQGQQPEALEALAAGLRFGQARGFVRSIADQDVAELLQECRAKVESGEMPGVSREYVERLLAASGRRTTPEVEKPARQAPALAAQAELVEPLTRRELEVLGLLASGASNAEIARRCSISLNTVKKHVNSIYGKLGASSRVQAVEQARRNKLI